MQEFRVYYELEKWGHVVIKAKTQKEAQSKFLAQFHKLSGKVEYTDDIEVSAVGLLSKEGMPIRAPR